MSANRKDHMAGALALLDDYVAMVARIEGVGADDLAAAFARRWMGESFAPSAPPSPPEDASTLEGDPAAPSSTDIMPTRQARHRRPGRVGMFPARDDELRRRFEAGQSDRTIALHWGCSPGTVMKRRSELGLVRKAPNVFPERDAELRRRFRAGDSDEAMADAWGCGPGAVQMRRIKLGLLRKVGRGFGEVASYLDGPPIAGGRPLPAPLQDHPEVRFEDDPVAVADRGSAGAPVRRRPGDNFERGASGLENAQ